MKNEQVTILVTKERIQSSERGVPEIETNSISISLTNPLTLLIILHWFWYSRHPCYVQVKLCPPVVFNVRPFFLSLSWIKQLRYT